MTMLTKKLKNKNKVIIKFEKIFRKKLTMPAMVTTMT